ncbi:jg9688 [Pararge aegeria aegeria]|uniref:Jg9688 protein n=1 Tax=Pararge aegeria aegeria TaxID=348720 RepID=A0A8S4RUF9_9NEOP|nr:jg9688 [Pararge aegeria aegeria]
MSEAASRLRCEHVESRESIAGRTISLRATSQRGKALDNKTTQKIILVHEPLSAAAGGNAVSGRYAGASWYTGAGPPPAAQRLQIPTNPYTL